MTSMTPIDLAGFPCICVVVPFAALVTDNRKHYTGQRRHVLTAEYRAAKDAIEHLARRVMAGRPPFAGPVRLDVVLWMPDARQRDLLNYSKILNDALSRIVYVDDSQIHAAHWYRGGIDRGSPHAVVTVRPLEAAGANGAELEVGR